MPATFQFERKLWRQGLILIAGVDEAGRGPLAGPVVAAAVIFPPRTNIKGLNDSKKLSTRQRERLFIQIQKKALGIGIARVGPKIIDRINILRATLLAMKLAVKALPIQPDYLLIDGVRMKIDLPIEQESIIGGDGKSASIAAASIVAKVTRDRIMLKYHQKHPQYGFAAHKGYGTKLHMRKLQEHGPSSIHRRSFAPVA